MVKGYEDLEMLIADALEGDAPTILAVTTTRAATLDMSAFRLGRQEMLRAVRRRWKDAEYACKTEYTTGYGAHSGGARRPHWNWLFKGVPVEDADALGQVIRRMWCRHVDAEPQAQYCEPLRTPAAALKYIVEHLSKASQRPPEGFKGQRFNVSRGYFSGTVTAQRQRARETQLLKREVWKAEQRGHSPADAEIAAQLALRRQVQTRWTLTTASGARLSREPVGPELTDRLRKARRDVATERRADGRTAAQPADGRPNLAPRPAPPGDPHFRPRVSVKQGDGKDARATDSSPPPAQAP